MDPKHGLIALAFAAAAAAPPAQAASSAVASASDSVSTTVDSVSRSFRRSSDSSSRTHVGLGDYEVIRVAEVDPGIHEVELQALPGNTLQGRYTLTLSAAALAEGGLVVGQRVRASERPYGYEFARVDTRTAFLLLLHDDWHRELNSVPLAL